MERYGASVEVWRRHNLFCTFLNVLLQFLSFLIPLGLQNFHPIHVQSACPDTETTEDGWLTEMLTHLFTKKVWVGFNVPSTHTSTPRYTFIYKTLPGTLHDHLCSYISEKFGGKHYSWSKKYSLPLSAQKASSELDRISFMISAFFLVLTAHWFKTKRADLSLQVQTDNEGLCGGTQKEVFSFFFS